MPTINLAVNQRSDPQFVPAGSIVTVIPSAGANAVVEYSMNAQADIINGVATWAAWRKGTASAALADLIGNDMWMRVTANVGGITLSINTTPTKADLAAYRGSFGAFDPANVAITGGTVNGTDVRDYKGDVRIANRSVLKSILDRARTQRVAFVGIGDSNQERNGNGWNIHMSLALMKAYGCYSTGLLPSGSAYTPGSSWGAGAGRNNVGANTGAPAALDGLSPSTAGIHPTYAYVASGNSQQVQSYQYVLASVNGAHPLDLTGNLLFRMSYGTFTSGGPGSFSPFARQDVSPYSTLFSDSAINPVTGANGVVDYSKTLAANAARTYNVAFCPAQPNNNITGPYFALYGSIENSDKTYGISWSPLVYYAGHTMRDFAVALTTWGAPACQEYFRQILLSLAPNTTNKTCVVVINGGMNDMSAGSGGPASVGPNPQTPANGSGAYIDNVQAIMNFLTTGWLAAGGAAGDLHFMLMPSHPFSIPDSTYLVSYRNAAIAFAHSQPNVSAIDISAIRPAADFKNLGWWDSGGNAHLNDVGYSAVANALCDDLTRDHAANVLSVNTTITVPQVAAAGAQDVTVTVLGACPQNAVALGLSAMPTAGLVYQAWVSALDTVKIRVQNITAAAITPPANDPITITVTR